MEQFLIDTNVVSDYLSASFSEKAMSFMDEAINQVPNLSVITEIELLCWKTDSSTEEKVRAFIAESTVVNIGNDVIASCVKIRKGKKIKTPDAIIAATAIAYNYTLITNNEKDFAGIEGLSLRNPLRT